MMKAFVIGAMLALTQALKLEKHDTLVFDKNGNLLYETNSGPKVDNTYAGPGAVALSDCSGKAAGT